MSLYKCKISYKGEIKLKQYKELKEYIKEGKLDIETIINDLKIETSRYLI